ncbi:hypothetical protein ACH4E7_33935 [Kitasatospora sp. NPDC018058]|uniref:hypothetical protein n=1 Tax=Kitasatospora sp. NPDC018058 TaxID=3364025 RepID=UPI0037BF2DE1
MLFYGTEPAKDLLARTVADAPAEASAAEALGTALEALGAQFQENSERVRLRDAVVSANAELRERELIKLAGLAEAMAGALRDRGTPEPAASLTAETGIAVFKVAFARWTTSRRWTPIRWPRTRSSAGSPCYWTPGSGKRRPTHGTRSAGPASPGPSARCVGPRRRSCARSSRPAPCSTWPPRTPG